MSSVERFVRESDVKPTCECAARKCGPHRCRWSTWGAACTGGLLVYVLVMHSFQMAERAEWRGTWQAKVLEQVLEQVRSTHATWQAQADALVRDATEDFATQLRAIPPLLAQVEALNWALTTPEVERDLQLKHAVEELQGRP